MRYLYTTLGKLPADKLGMILPHEHVFVDLRTPDQPGYADADADSVLSLMVPQIEAIKALGVTPRVEHSTKTCSCGRIMPADKLGMILPHEHVFVDLRTPDHPGYADADVDSVLSLMVPQIEAIKALGVTALVECSTGGVGRRADLDLAVSLATDFPIVVPTGNYREPWIPAWVRDADETALFNWMLAELETGIEATGFRAGWIKLSAGDDGITPLETRILRAAVRASVQTGALIGSHTIRGSVVMDQLDIIEAAGGSCERFLSIHTHAEPDFDLHKAIAARGAWIEYDNIGAVPVDESAALIDRALGAGLGNKLLISHDRGWYDPAQPGGGEPKPYTVVNTDLLPLLERQGMKRETVTQLFHINPFEAFARP